MVTFQIVKLGKVVNFVNEKIETSKINLENYISTENLLPNKSGIVDATTLPKINKVNHFVEEDVVFSNIRTYFKKVWFCKFEGGASNDILIFRPVDTDILDKRFLYYVISSDSFIGYTVASSKGTKMPRGDKEAMKVFEFRLPLINTQRKIASLLSSYDDLIENNEKRIMILEEMAQLLYTEWFVKFKFPGHEKVKLVDSGTEFGLIPEGWEIKNVDSLIKRIPVGKKYENKSVFEMGKVPVLDQGKTGLIGYHNDEPGVKASTKNPVIVFANHTCYQNIIVFPFSAIQNVLPFIPNDERHIIWLHWATKDLIKFNDYKGHWPEFMSKKLIIPDVELTKKFGNIVGRYVEMRYKLETINKNLSQIRDLLIPQLVTGKRELK